MRIKLFLYSILTIAMILLVLPMVVSNAQSLSPAEKARLESELAQIEAEQRQAERELSQAQAQSASISRDISVLDAKIKAAQLNIKAKTLLIQTLGNDINQKVKHIDSLEVRIGRGRQTLGQLMRKTYEIDSYTMPEVLLAQTSITGFFEDIDTFESVQQGLQNTFEQIRSDKEETEVEKQT